MTDLVDSDKLQDYLSVHSHIFWLPPDRWNSAPSLHFEWEAVKLSGSNRVRVPAESGVYTLIIMPGIYSHPHCSYLAYAGKSNNLKRRFGEYLTKERRTRKKIRSLLRKWGEFICFCYAKVAEEELEKFEDALLQHYVPPFASRYKGTLKQAVGAF